MEVHRMVVEANGSGPAHAAVEWCAAHAQHDDEVVVVAAMARVGEFVLAFPPSDLGYWKSGVTDALEGSWTAPLRKKGVHYRTQMLDETPWKAVLDVAHREHADAIVVGRETHPHGFGSANTAERLVRHSDIPVLVIPAPSVRGGDSE